MAYDPWDLSAYGTAPSGPPSGYKPVTNPSGQRGYQSPSGNIRIDYVRDDPWKVALGEAARADFGDAPFWPGFDLPGSTPTTSGGGSGSGGGGGAAPINWGAVGTAMQYSPRKYTWQNLDYQDYQGQPFREFNSGKYDMLRSGLTEAVGADRTAGNAQYDQLLAELGDYQNPWANPTPQTTNPAMSQAMQRMFNANGTPTNINQADTDRGVQADAAFGNLLAVLGIAADQEQGSRVRSTEGYRRNLNERLDAEQRGGTLAVGMSEANARELYEREKWEYGEEIARMNYNNRMANAQYNNQGVNSTNQANTQTANDVYGGNMSWILDMIASGQVPPEMVMAGAMGLNAEGER